MDKFSNELMEFARSRIKMAIEKKEWEVEIILSESFPNDTIEVQKHCETLQLKNITEALRKEFNNYNIKSIVKSKGNLTTILTFKKGPCALFYPLVWCLSLQEK